MTIDVSDAFSIGLEKMTGTRNPGSFVSGRWVTGTATPLSFMGFPQNAKPADLLVLPEGNRTSESIKIHTTFELIAEVKGSTNGDVISYKGKTWLVHSVAHRYIGNYHKAIAIRQ